MPDYTIPILLTLAIVLNYYLVYLKNRMVGNIVFISIGISSFYIATITSNHNAFIGVTAFGLFILIIGFLSTLYDWFGHKTHG